MRPVKDLYVDERDPISLANAIKRLIENQELRRQLGMQARQKVLQDFEIQQSTSKLASIFHKVVSNDETRL